MIGLSIEIWRILKHAFKSALSIVILGHIMIGLYEAVEMMGISLGASVVDLEKCLQSLLEKLPHVKDAVAMVFDVKGVIGNTGNVNVSLYTEITYGLLLLFSFKLMSFINGLVDQIFGVGDKNLWMWIIDGIAVIFNVMLAIMLAGILEAVVEEVTAIVGLQIGSYALIAAIVLGVGIGMWMSKKKNAFLDAAFEVVFGFLTVAIIYIFVLCFQLLPYSSAMAPQELLIVIVVMFACILFFTLQFAKVFSNTLVKIFGKG